jgi:hypothetical protein
MNHRDTEVTEEEGRGRERKGEELPADVISGAIQIEF